MSVHQFALQSYTKVFFVVSAANHVGSFPQEHRSKQSQGRLVSEVNNQIAFFLTVYGLCIVIYVRNKNQRDAFSFLICFSNYPLHVSNRLTIHHQKVVYCICSQWYLSRSDRSC